MAIERDPAIEQHLRERDPAVLRQRHEEQRRFLERLGQIFLKGPGQEDADSGSPPPYTDDADDPEPPEFQDTVVLCATHTEGMWKLVGRWAGEKEIAPHTLLKHREPEVLRELCRERGYLISIGKLLVEHHTGLEIWKRGNGGEGL